MGRGASASQKKIGQPSSSFRVTSKSRSLCFTCVQEGNIGKGLNIIRLLEFYLNGHLTFTKKTKKDRYWALCHKNIIPCEYIHHSNLETLSIKPEILGLIQKTGKESYFSITFPAYIELVLEFYMTFEFLKPDNFTISIPRVVRFRLMKHIFKRSITVLSLSFGFVTDEFAKYWWIFE